jgi:hypothetical protein
MRHAHCAVADWQCGRVAQPHGTMAQVQREQTTLSSKHNGTSTTVNREERTDNRRSGLSTAQQNRQQTTPIQSIVPISMSKHRTTPIQTTLSSKHRTGPLSNLHVSILVPVQQQKTDNTNSVQRFQHRICRLCCGVSRSQLSGTLADWELGIWDGSLPSASSSGPLAVWGWAAGTGSLGALARSALLLGPWATIRETVRTEN